MLFMLRMSRFEAPCSHLHPSRWRTPAGLEIDQARVSKLQTGQMAGFSIQRLVHFLSLLGQDVEVTVRKARRGRRRG